MNDLSPDYTLRIATSVAEMLALPQMACGRRQCRRDGRCSYYFKQSKQPCCLDNLNATQRAVYEEVRTDAEYVARNWGIQRLFARTAASYELRQLAVEIVRFSLPPAHRRPYAAWLRLRDTEMQGITPPASPETTRVAAAPDPSGARTGSC